MHKTIRIGSVRMWASIRKVEDIKGMCSNTNSGKHILMWDFDGTTFGRVSVSLRIIQERCQLPKITILETKAGCNFIAYCFEELEWEDALAIVLDTDGVCWNFFRLSVIRGYFTLRVSPKGGRIPYFRAEIPGKSPQKITVDDLVHAINYETSKVR
ncbi:hypothetical protein ES707_20481 [subsurface metagenome]